jgi:hypothetical protein
MGGVLQSGDTEFKTRLWILDGLRYLMYDGSAVVPVDTVGYVPLTNIARTPKGGGEGYEKINMLSPKRINQFEGTKDDRDYQLETDGITGVVSAEKLDANGNWVSAGAYTVNTRTGVVTFSTAPGAPPVTGEDNVRITYTKEVAGYADRINKCDVCTLFGVNNYDMAFVTGNRDYANSDFCCYNQKPNYFPDTGYSNVGQGNSAIVGYHKVTGYLAVVKEGNGQDAAVFLRSGEVKTADSNVETVFYLKQGVAGEGAVAKRAFASIGSDHMFLTARGVVSMTVNAITNERSLNMRSGFVGRALAREPDMHKAVCCEHNGYMYLALNGRIYVADGNQPKSYPGKNENEYSYEWFLWDSIDVECFFSDGGRLYFGNAEGWNMFHNAPGLEVYTDNGRPGRAYWTTPLVYLKTYENYKTVSDMYTRMMPANRSSVGIYMKTEGEWRKIDNALLDIFTFGDIDFRRFSFNLNTDESIIPTRKIKEKYIRQTQFRFENGEAEAFGLYSSVVNFYVKKNIK